MGTLPSRFGARLTETLKIYDRVGLNSYDSMSTLPEPQRLSDIYARCVHGNLIDMRGPLRAAAKNREQGGFSSEIQDGAAATVENLPHFPFV